jgi:hypothetical protein
VCVSNAHGQLSLEAELDPALVAGAVALTHGGGNQQGGGMRVARRFDSGNPNALLPSGEGSFEPLSSQAFMTGVPVQVELAPEG